MRLAPEAAKAFIDRYNHLMFFSGQTRGIISKAMTFEAFKEIDLEKRAECRNALYKPKPLFSAYLQEHTSTLTDDEFQIVQSLAEHHRFGQFTIVRHLKKHTVFLDSHSPVRAYGVYSLFDDISEIVPADYLPHLVETALLPYKGVIVYDGLLLGYNIFIGSNMRWSMEEEYELAKMNQRFYTSLTEAPKPPSPEEVLAYKIKERGELPIRKVRGLATQVKKVKQLEWELADAPEKKRAKLEQQLQDARLKVSELIITFFEKDIERE